MLIQCRNHLADFCLGTVYTKEVKLSKTYTKFVGAIWLILSFHCYLKGARLRFSTEKEALWCVFTSAKSPKKLARRQLRLSVLYVNLGRSGSIKQQSADAMWLLVSNTEDNIPLQDEVFHCTSSFEMFACVSLTQKRNQCHYKGHIPFLRSISEVCILTSAKDGEKVIISTLFDFISAESYDQDIARSLHQLENQKFDRR